ncbi:hypothetical protein D3C77_786100 [compost metagenome]
MRASIVLSLKARVLVGMNASGADKRLAKIVEARDSSALNKLIILLLPSATENFHSRVSCSK